MQMASKVISSSIRKLKIIAKPRLPLIENLHARPSSTLTNWKRPFLGLSEEPTQLPIQYSDLHPFQFLERSLLNPFLSPVRKTGLDFNRLLVDIIEHEDSYEVHADLPGFQKDSVDVKIDGDVLYISAEKSDDLEENTDRFFRRERFIGKVNRSIQLPLNLNQDEIKATFDNGVLIVKIPKLEPKLQGKKIAIS